jgi:septum formation protein
MAPIILASTSPIRRRILKNAGLDFTIANPEIDEQAIRTALFEHGNRVAPDELASVLAQAKALVVSKKFPQSVIVGADQVLNLGEDIFGKPATKQQAKTRLIALRGKTHILTSAVCCALGEDIIWRDTQDARLTMRDFSNNFLGAYLAAQGDDVLATVGGYKVEHDGIQLFSELDGDYFTILGLPLMPLLAFLRARGDIDT